MKRKRQPDPSRQRRRDHRVIKVRTAIKFPAAHRRKVSYGPDRPRVLRFVGPDMPLQAAGLLAAASAIRALERDEPDA